MSESDLEFEIGNNITRYCDYEGFKNPDTRELFQTLWTNYRFLNALVEIVYKYDNVKSYIKKYYNRSVCKIAYDYYVKIGSKNPNDIITKKLLDLVFLINVDSILPLTTFVKKIDAIFIVMSKYSSFNKDECYKRVNEFILRLGYNFTSMQIVDIYTFLYISEPFSPVFNATMIQTYDLSTLDTIELSNYYHMNSAILMIVNSMTSSDIYKLLSVYANYIEMYNEPTRFNIATIDRDYSRIIPILNQLISEGVIFR